MCVAAFQTLMCIMTPLCNADWLSNKVQVDATAAGPQMILWGAEARGFSCICVFLISLMFKWIAYYIHNFAHFFSEGLAPQYLFRPRTWGHFQLSSNLDTISQICGNIISLFIFILVHAQCRRTMTFLFYSAVDCIQTYLVLTPLC